MLMYVEKTDVFVLERCAQLQKTEINMWKIMQFMVACLK